MHELNILSPLSLARFFLTQQLIYKSKIEKHNISLDILYQALVQYCQKPSSNWGNNILATTDSPFFGSDFSICVVCSSEVDKKWVTATSGDLMVKSKPPPQSGSHSSLEAVKPHP